jgi:hypothetical protein
MRSRLFAFILLLLSAGTGAAQSYPPTIPSTANPFYIEDSYALNPIQPGNPWGFDPGSFAWASGVSLIQPGQSVTLWMTWGYFGLIPAQGNAATFDIDVSFEFYSSPFTGSGTPTHVYLVQGAPYSQFTNPTAFSAVVNPTTNKDGVFAGPVPMVFTGVAPASCPCMLGPHFNFNSNLSSPENGNYRYGIMGAWQAY